MEARVRILVCVSVQVAASQHCGLYLSCLHLECRHHVLKPVRMQLAMPKSMFKVNAVVGVAELLSASERTRLRIALLDTVRATNPAAFAAAVAIDTQASLRLLTHQAYSALDKVVAACGVDEDLRENEFKRALAELERSRPVFVPVTHRVQSCRVGVR